MPIESIHAFLVVLHEDNSADIYINDFGELAEIQVKESVKAGEPILLSNVSDIRRVMFNNIEIKKADAIVYVRRIDWRFSLYFDFRREIDLDALSLKIGELRKEAAFYASMVSADARIAEDEQINAFIFAEGKTDWKHLFAAGRKLKLPFSLSFGNEG